MRTPLASVFQAILLSLPLSLACSAGDESPTGSTSTASAGQSGACADKNQLPSCPPGNSASYSCNQGWSCHETAGGAGAAGAPGGAGGQGGACVDPSTKPTCPPGQFASQYTCSQGWICEGAAPGGSGPGGSGPMPAGAGGAPAGMGGVGGAPGGSGGVAGIGGQGGATSEFQALPCLQAGLAAQLKLDSIEVLSATFDLSSPGGMQGPWTSVFTDGTPCMGSPDPAACLTKVDEQKKATTSSQLQSAGPSIGNTPFSDRELLVLTAAGSVSVLTTVEQVSALLGPLDSLAKLGLWLRYAYPNGCAYQVRAVEGGYEVWVLHILVSDCPISYKKVLYRVTLDGQATALKEEADGGSGACAGRRPEGLWPEVSADEGSALGAFFARMAYLEAASIEAFARLHDELARHGAPVELAQECLVSAADEVRHASAMSELADRFGATPAEVRLSPPRDRSLLELALENAVEGCVRETYGALEASYQASHADDPEVRATMGRIARDETAHATFSWNLHTWLEDRLSEREWQQVEQAMREASIALRGELSRPRELSLVTVAGLPDEDMAQALLEGLEERLWGEPHRLVA